LSKPTSENKISVFSLENSLRELNPRRTISRGRTRRIIYNRINTNLLTPDWIRRKYSQKNAKTVPNIILQGNYYIFQYQDYPSFYLSLNDGRLYYLPIEDIDLEHLQRTASIFLEIIRERVEGFRIRDYEPNIQFLEDTEGREKKVEQSTIKNRSLFIFSNFIPSASKRKEENR